MEDKKPENLILKALTDVLDLASADVIHDREKWDELVRSQPEDQRELTKELTRFAELWEYFDQHKMKLGEDVLAEIERAHQLPIKERTECFRKVNQKLLERIPDANNGTQLRM